MFTIELPLPGKEELARLYTDQVDTYEKALYEQQRRLKQLLFRAGIPCTIKYRVKSFESIFQKVIRKLRMSGQRSGAIRMNDLLGIRVVCAFIEDLNKAESQIQGAFDVVEVERKGSDYSVKEFGYESTHYLVRLPDDITDGFHLNAEIICEIQLRTILQDAWAEVEHELVYKADFTPFDEPLRRKLAALNANLSLSDIIFQEIRDYQRQLHSELKKRRELFWRKLADVSGEEGESLPEELSRPDTDFDAGIATEAAANGNGAGEIAAPVPNGEQPPVSSPSASRSESGESGSRAPEQAEDPDFRNGEFMRSLMLGGDTIDNMLLKALAAHNKNKLDYAIRVYSEILKFDPKEYIRAIIHVHRGMAFFTRSEYQSAIDDFSKAIELDATNPKAYYYRGIVNRVLGHYAQAMEDLNACIELDPFQFDPLYARAQVYYQLGDYGGALQDLEHSLGINPESERCRQFRDLVMKKVDSK